MEVKNLNVVFVMCHPAGESRAVSVDSKQSHVVLSNLSAGFSYMITIFSTQGRVQSDALTSTITTGTQLAMLNVSYSYTFVFPLHM